MMAIYRLASLLFTLSVAAASDSISIRGAGEKQAATKLPEVVASAMDKELADAELQHFQDRLLSGETTSKADIEDHLRVSRRTDENCAATQGGIDLFDISVALKPSSLSESCSMADQVFLGNAINLLILEYGIGDSGDGDGAIYLAGVCPEPTTTSTSTRRHLQPIRLIGYVYTGGGACRYCYENDNDARTRSLATSSWFNNQFKPQLEATLEAAIANELAPKHAACLGSNPAITVEVEGVNLWELNLSCNGSTGSGTVPLLETTGHDIWSLGSARSTCGTCSKIDFGEFSKGQYIRHQYQNEFGLEITSSGGYSDNGGPRIFDTSNPGTDNNDGDPDLGSPNEDCPGGGPGKGSGGEPGKEGENCVPIGNVLIIQESNKVHTDDNAGGGTITFEFDEPVLISDVGMMDIDERSQKFKFTFDNGVTSTYGYRGMGDNSVQRVVANKSNVVKLEVVLPSSGAVTELNVCQSCS